MMISDTIIIEVLVAPSNATMKGYTIEISGDESAASYNQNTGMLVGLTAGEIKVKAIMNDKDSLSFTRTIEIKEVPVSTITIYPSEAELYINDTLFLTVEVLPANATRKEFTFQVIDNFSVIEFDESTGMIVAKNTGNAVVKAIWMNGDIEGIIDITVYDPTGEGLIKHGNIPNIYPIPNQDLLHIDIPDYLPFHLLIIDISGRVVIDENFTGSTTVETHHLIPGFYEAVLQIRDEIVRQKVVIL